MQTFLIAPSGLVNVALGKNCGLAIVDLGLLKLDGFIREYLILPSCGKGL